MDPTHPLTIAQIAVIVSLASGLLLIYTRVRDIARTSAEDVKARAEFEVNTKATLEHHGEEIRGISNTLKSHLQEDKQALREISSNVSESSKRLYDKLEKVEEGLRADMRGINTSQLDIVDRLGQIEGEIRGEKKTRTRRSS